jgi:phage baseplate assembly protein W
MYARIKKICRLDALLSMVVSLGFLSASASAAETVTYTYDAKGRLVKVTHTGTTNNNVETQYTYDKANNRKTTTTTGSTN